MTALVDGFLFLFKTKFRRKLAEKLQFRTTTLAAVFPDLRLLHLLLTTAILLPTAAYGQTDVSVDKCSNVECGNGVCVNGTCVCHDGWQGSQCQYCGGKVK